jgi:hypothetical protein
MWSILLGALLVISGVLLLAAPPLWRGRLRGGFQNPSIRLAMMKMHAAVRRARIMRPSRS